MSELLSALSCSELLDKELIDPEIFVGNPDFRFVLLDSCNEPLVQQAISRLNNDGKVQSLYSGRASVEYGSIAPYLAENDNWLSTIIVHQLLDRPWGYFINSPLSFRELRSFLRRFLTALLPDGRKVLFRFYDPRVLAGFLVASDGPEVRLFFSKIDFVLFAFQSEFIKVSASTKCGLASRVFEKGGLRICQGVYNRMQRQIAERYARKILPYLASEFPQRWGTGTDQERIEGLINITLRAETFGFATEVEVMRFIEVVSLVGDNFGDLSDDQVSLRLLQEPATIARWPLGREFVAASGRKSR